MIRFVADNPAHHLKGLDPKFFFLKNLKDFFFKEERESKYQQAPKKSQKQLGNKVATFFVVVAFPPFSVEHQSFFLWHGCQRPRNSPRSFGHLPHGWRTALGE